MPTSKECWVVRERILAGWFKTNRNPLSGRNNVDDQGKRRLGDAAYPYALLESKLVGKHAAISRARDTWRQAKEAGKPFLHVEFQKGSNAVVGLFVTKELAAELCGYLDRKWRNDGKQS